MAVIVNIISMCSLRIKAHNRNQPKKTALAMYMLLLKLKSHIKQFYKSEKWSAFITKVILLYVRLSRQ